MRKITIEYKTTDEACKYCGQELSNVDESSIKEFIFDEERVLSYGNWEASIGSPDDFPTDVMEYVFETIVFFAEDAESKVIVNGQQLNRMEQFIKEIVQSS
ncbi:hypothetical protein [Shouchella lehensis]|uniref:Uncharacterized protein n=1 Tax=Shouchella lehensis G1 TaxID=1246626 RepID=A0A060M053_9BACI|nr:hypothetical protein [Shouchella lehensis]AIC95400.1 hypothetical protein BleG1_2836 [Shouchella lehensis G1]